MKPALKKLIISISLVIFSGQVFALRCGHRLVDVGDRKAKVYLRCGDPDFRENRERYIPRNCNDGGYVDDYGYVDSYRQQNCRVEIIDVWTYNLGTRKFMRELVFVNGVLKEINSLGYGY